MTPFTDVELERLLERPVRHLLTPFDRASFAGRRILITGAGGSIGSELARQLALCGPSRLTLVDQSEYNLFQIERELAELAPGLRVDAEMADITRRSVMRQVFATAQPDVVYHAAALSEEMSTNLAPTLRAQSATTIDPRTLTIAAEHTARSTMVTCL